MAMQRSMIFALFTLFSFALAEKHPLPDSPQDAKNQQCATKECATNTDPTSLLMTKQSVSELSGRQVKKHTQLEDNEGRMLDNILPATFPTPSDTNGPNLYKLMAYGFCKWNREASLHMLAYANTHDNPGTPAEKLEKCASACSELGWPMPTCFSIATPDAATSGDPQYWGRCWCMAKEDCTVDNSATDGHNTYKTYEFYQAIPTPDPYEVCQQKFGQGVRGFCREPFNKVTYPSLYYICCVSRLTQTSDTEEAALTQTSDTKEALTKTSDTKEAALTQTSDTKEAALTKTSDTKEAALTKTSDTKEAVSSSDEEVFPST